MAACTQMEDCPLLRELHRDIQTTQRYSEETRKMVDTNRIEARDDDKEFFNRLDNLKNWIMAATASALATLVVAVIMFVLGRVVQ